jgi:hypothetical protein
VTWLTPLAARTVAMVALAAAVLVIIAYLLKMRRRRFEVPFSSLWKRVLEQRDANSLWKQLRRLLSLLLTLAIVGADRRRGVGADPGRHRPPGPQRRHPARHLGLDAGGRRRPPSGRA